MMFSPHIYKKFVSMKTCVNTECPCNQFTDDVKNSWLEQKGEKYLIPLFIVFFIILLDIKRADI